ncbi:hypothetical protein NIB75_11190 [Bacteroides uniformis]|nr:hypothetical protein [Bacteroides uniformis]
MEQGLVQNIDMPLSSIGTMASEVTSVVNATTQVAKQILNMSLSQVKVHLKSNYEMYIQEESRGIEVAQASRASGVTEAL